MPDSGGAPTRERLLRSGARLIAKKGFDGVSVRDVCRDADTSANMIHHYFGSKAGLLDAIVERFSIHVFAVPMRLLEAPAKSQAEFRARIEILFETTLEAYTANRDVSLVVAREQADPPALVEYMTRFTDFLEDAKARGFVRRGLETRMVAGALLDRIANQVQFAPWIKRNYGADISDPEYKKRWCASNLDLFLFGMVPPSPNAPRD